MPLTISLEVTNDHPVPVEPSLGGSVTVTNVSGSTLFYADTPQVLSTNNQGSLTAGQSTSFSVGQWLRSAGLSSVTATVSDPGNPVSGVASFNLRTGVVTPTSGDYTAALVTNTADKSSVSQQAFTGEVQAPDFKPTGLTGATAAGRHVGTTAAGAPASGTFVLGDWVTDQAGKRWTCTVGGSPGTWVQEPGTGGGGSFGATVATKTTGYTLTGTDEVILADATGGAFALTLPTAVGFLSHYILKAINTNSNLVALNTTSAQTVDGNASGVVTLGALSSTALYNAAILVSDGANWRIV